MKKLIFRNIFKDITYFFILSSLSLTLIVWVIQSVNFLDYVTEDGHGLGVYATYSLLNLPKIFTRLTLFLFFISTFFVLFRYDDNNEISIFWTHGIKKIEFINNFIKFSLVFVIIQLLFSYFVVPTSQEKARNLFKNSDIDYFPSILKSKFFNDTIEDVTIFIGNKDVNGNLKEIFLMDNKKSKTSSQIILSKSGNLLKKDGNFYLILKDGNIINLDQKKSNILQFNKSEFNLSKYNTKTTTYPKIQETNSNTLLKCLDIILFKKEESTNKILNCDPQSVEEIKKEMYKRLFIPLYLFLIGIISSALILQNKKNKNFNIFKFVIFFLGFASIIFSEISVQFISSNIINNVIITITPLLVSFLIYILIKINLKYG